MKKFLKVLGIILLVLLVILIALVGRVDRTPYQETKHYAAWQSWIADQDFAVSRQPLQVAWAKRNITPDQSYPMAGYGDRWGKHFEGVRDSLFVRAISVLTPGGNVTFVSADLLIVPIDVRLRLEDLLEKEGIAKEEIHLGAIHSHHGLGGWGKKLIGRLFAGKYDEQVEIMLAERFRDAILASREHPVPATIQYMETTYEEGIKNRLKVENKTIDPEVRSLVFTRADGKKAVMLVYGAHTVILPAELLELSRDYPGHVVDDLEAEEEVDFALFFAGAVGSMGYNAEGETKSERSAYMGRQLADRFLSRYDREKSMDAFGDPAKTAVLDDPGSGESLRQQFPFYSQWIQIPLPAPTARISVDYALRTWVFNSLFGSSPGDIKVTLIGRTLILGMPADFSGEIMKELDEYAKVKGLDLIITSFNGNYMGYITHDKHYETNLYETVTMSWHGYQMGGYYTQVSKDIIDHIAFSINRL